MLYNFKVIRAMTLSTALRVNAAFTAFCALACLAGSYWIVPHTALPGTIWALALGAMLASYVPILLIAAKRPMVWLVKTIIVLDWGYVAIAAVFLLTHLGKADGLGLALIIGSTSLVALFALLQMRGLSALQRESRV